MTAPLLTVRRPKKPLDNGLSATVADTGAIAPKRPNLSAGSGPSPMQGYDPNSFATPLGETAMRHATASTGGGMKLPMQDGGFMPFMGPTVQGQAAAPAAQNPTGQRVAPTAGIGGGTTFGNPNMPTANIGWGVSKPTNRKPLIEGSTVDVSNKKKQQQQEEEIVRPPVNSTLPTSGPWRGTQFDRDNNLIGTQIMPGTTPRIDASMGRTDTASQGYENYNPMAFSKMNPLDASVTRDAYGNSLTRALGNNAPGYEGVKSFDASGVREGLKLSSSMGQNLGLYGIDPNTAGGSGGASFGGDTQRARELTMRGLESSFDSPDRGALAAEAFELARKRTDPQYQKDLRQVGQRAAALGRVGAGLTTNELTDVHTLREDRLDQTRAEMANQAAGLKLNDDLSRVSAGQGVAQGFGGLDLEASRIGNAAGDSNFRNRLDAAGFTRDTDLMRADATRRGALDVYGVDRDSYDDDVRERDTRYGVGQAQYNSQLDKAEAERRYGSDMYGLDSDDYGRRRDERDTELAHDRYVGDVSRNKMLDFAGEEQRQQDQAYRERGEARGERGYQGDEEQRNIDNETRRLLVQDDLTNSEFNRGLARTKVGLEGMNTHGTADLSNMYRDLARDSFDSINASVENYADRRAQSGLPPGAPRPGAPLRDQYGNEIDPATGRPKPRGL